MRCFDISSRNCRLPGGSYIEFIILRTLILDYNFTVRTSVFNGTDKANTDTFYCFNPFPNKPWFLRVCKQVL